MINIILSEKKSNKDIIKKWYNSYKEFVEDEMPNYKEGTKAKIKHIED
jgi:hypothetical protein